MRYKWDALQIEQVLKIIFWIFLEYDLQMDCSKTAKSNILYFAIHTCIYTMTLTSIDQPNLYIFNLLN